MAITADKDKQPQPLIDTYLNKRYKNLNLNQNHKSPDNARVQTSSTTSPPLSRKHKKSEVTDYNERSKNLQTWNKSIATTTSNEQSLKSITIIINEKAIEEEVRRLLKKKHNSQNSCNSTLSLHIAAHENSVGTSSNASDKFRYGSNYGLKKKKEKLGLIKRALQIFTGSSTVIQNPFEFPRQQEEDGQTPDPEMMHFKASQKLLNPNEFTPSSVEDAIKNVPTIEEVLELLQKENESYKENQTIEEAIGARNLLNVIYDDVVENNAEETLDNSLQHQNQLNNSCSSDIDKYLATIKSCSITNSTEDISQYNPLNEDNNDDEDDVDDRNVFKVDKQIDPIDPDDYENPYKQQYYISRGQPIPIRVRGYNYQSIHKNFGSGYLNDYDNSGDSQEEEYETSSCDDEDRQRNMYEKVTLYDGTKQGYDGIYSDDEEQRSESSNGDMKTILHGNNEEFENENYEAQMPVLNVLQTLNKSCYVDENGILRFNTFYFFGGIQGNADDKFLSEIVTIYNSQWRIVIQISKGGQLGMFIECMSRGLNSLRINYPCHVKLSSHKFNYVTDMEREYYHVFDGTSDYGFSQFGYVTINDNVRWFQASVNVLGRAPCGLVNLTTLCYMNVILQSLFALTEFRRIILKADVQNEVVRALQKLFISMQFGQIPCDSKNVFFSTKWAKQENSFHQQDIEEFLTCFIEEIEDALIPVGLDNELRNLLRGFTCNYTESPEFNYKSKIETPIYVHQLNMLSPDNSVINNMHSTLKQYCRTQHLDGDNCIEVLDHGKQPVNVSYRYKNLPPILSIYLMRSKFDPVRGMVKITDNFHFPRILDMNEYMAPPEDDDNVDDTITDDYTYVLQSIITHKGTGSSGHYTAFINYKPTISDLWYLFDDRHVNVFTEKSLFKDDDTFLQHGFGTPCMFFYIKKNSVRELTSPSPTICNISPSLREELQPFIIKIKFLHYTGGKIFTKYAPEEQFEIQLTTAEIFEYKQEWLFSQASNHFGVEIGQFNLWAYDAIVDNENSHPSCEVICSTRPIAELPCFENDIHIIVQCAEFSIE
uniref:Ubiquitin carboxyl-terminal hydrolase 7 n=1 Tax=Panagrolaimus sp. PS1159 TaxID=55785 RepID=A0AC35GSN4_9BILA